MTRDTAGLPQGDPSALPASPSPEGISKGHWGPSGNTDPAPGVQPLQRPVTGGNSGEEVASTHFLPLACLLSPPS